MGRRLLLGFCLLVAGGCSSDPSTPLATTHFDVVARAELGSAVAGADVVAQTSFDPEVQRMAEDAMDALMPEVDGRFVAAMAVLDVELDAIVAVATSTATDRNLLDQQRASGSTLKFVVDVAMARAGVDAEDGVFGGARCAFPDGVSAPEELNRPVLSVRDATADSSNCAFGKMARTVGAERLLAAAHDIGFDRTLVTTTDFGFGANTVSLRELLHMVATVANGGRRSAATLITSTTRPSYRTLSAETVATVIDMTHSVVVDGTAGQWQLDDRWAIAKTGTTESSADAWIVGATPQFAAAVWIGNPSNPDDGMVQGAVPGYESVHGGDLPGALWHRVMNELHIDQPSAELPSITPTRDVVVIVDPTTDCLARSESVQIGPPGPDVPWIPTGGVIEC